jgi:iron complex outermembrane recepter protein
MDRARLVKLPTIATWLVAVSVSGHAAAEDVAGHQATGQPAEVRQQAPASVSNDGVDIVVTALKRSSTAQRVPAAITAVSGDSLVKFGTTSINQLPALAPGLQIQPIRNQAFIYLRGVGQTLTTPNADPANATNINNVYVPSEMTSNAFFDIERIEVVPGPQGTLYGRNSTGGVINLTTRRPGEEFAAEGFVEIGDYNRLQTFLGVDVPVSGTLSVRAAATTIKHDGYASNGLDDQDSQAARLTLSWKPDSRTTVTATAGYSHDGGLGAVNYNNPPTYDPSDRRKIDFDAKVYGLTTDFESTALSLEINHKLSDKVELTYVGGYNEMDAYQKSAGWSGPPPAIVIATYTINSHSHEFRLNGTFGKTEIVGGFYYFYSRSWFTGDLQANASIRSVTGPFFSKSEGEAAFAQVTQSLTDRLRLTAGARFSHTAKLVDGINQRILPVVSVTPYVGTSKLDRLDWKGAFEFDVAPRSMLYGSVATGFTPGGLSAAPLAIGQTAAAPFKPVKLTAYTLGVKNRFFDNRLTFNLEGFYYDYRDYQVVARNPLTQIAIVYNAEKARIYGIQLDASLRPTSFDTISASVVRVNADAVKLITPACNCNGFQLPYAPDWTVNASWQHVFDLGRSGEIEASVNFQYNSSRWGFYNHPAATHIDAYHKTDLNLTYRPKSGKWSVGAWVRNLEDAEIFTTGFTGAIPGPAAFGLAAPRTFGGRFSFDL